MTVELYDWTDEASYGSKEERKQLRGTHWRGSNKDKEGKMPVMCVARASAAAAPLLRRGSSARGAATRDAGYLATGMAAARRGTATVAAARCARAVT